LDADAYVLTESKKRTKGLLTLDSNSIYKEVRKMDLITTLVVILLILWLLGSLGSVGGLIHILLVIAIILILLRIIEGRRPL
jgi:hypothetical protein